MKLGVTFAVGLSAMLLTAASTADDKASAAESRSRYSEAGVATPGSPIHAWISAHSVGARSDTPIAYSFTFNDEASIKLLERVHRYDASSAEKTAITFDAPPPPGWNPPAPGATTTSSACGYPISYGSDAGTATMEFHWEFRNTRDSDGDGDKDTDPAWVLVGYEATNIEVGTTMPPLEC